jgi:phosphoglycerol transferase MdoB-like AlkP superfamily enzyme
MRSYLMGTGYQQLRWKADYPANQQHSAQWGVRDDLMFSSLLADIRGESSDHWMKTLLTLSSHEPWDVPTHDLDDEVYNAFHYLDRCIGDFIDALRQTPQWDNLLVVILPDHGFRYQGIDETTRLYNHIPMLWVGGAVSEPQRIDRLCNQSDLAATLLGQMGLPHDDYTFSRDVVSHSHLRPMAYHTYNNGVTLYDSTGFVAYDLDARQVIAHEGPDSARLLRQAKALLQLTAKDLKNK